MSTDSLPTCKVHLGFQEKTNELFHLLSSISIKAGFTILSTNVSISLGAQN